MFSSSQSSLLPPVQALMCPQKSNRPTITVHKTVTGYTQNSASSLLYQKDLKLPKWDVFYTEEQAPCFHSSSTHLFLYPNINSSSCMFANLWNHLPSQDFIFHPQSLSCSESLTYNSMTVYWWNLISERLGGLVQPNGFVLMWFKQNTFQFLMAEMFDSSSYISNGKCVLKNKHLHHKSS